MRIGWLSSGHDQAACNLLSDIVARAQQDDIPLDIAAAFCDRERGESPESDRYLDLVERLDIPLVTLSSAQSWAAAQKESVSRAGPSAAGTRSSTCTPRSPAVPPAPGRRSSGSCSKTKPRRPAP